MQFNEQETKKPVVQKFIFVHLKSFISSTIFPKSSTQSRFGLTDWGSFICKQFTEQLF